MTTVVFVHGTGVREPIYSAIFKLVKDRLHAERPEITVTRCAWGEEVGARLHAGGGSIPLYDTSRGCGSDEDVVACWAQLYQDPFAELRLLAARAPAHQSYVPGRPTPGEALDATVRAFQPSAKLSALLVEVGLGDELRASRQLLVDQSIYGAALRAASEDTRYQLAAYDAIARSMVAAAFAICEQADKYLPILFDAQLRNRVVDSIRSELVGDNDRAIGGWVAKQALGLATIGATNYALRKRGAISDAAAPAASDVAHYLVRGQQIRHYIRDVILDVTPPVVVIAHSLGGVACVDLLIKEKLPQVRLLVTVGTQVPLLYEIDALPALSFGNRLPDHFPAEWLNLYDLRDLLSYVGATVFPGRVQDVLVDSQQPFPRAHGAYWVNPTTWKTIIPRIPR